MSTNKRIFDTTTSFGGKKETKAPMGYGAELRIVGRVADAYGSHNTIGYVILNEKNHGFKMYSNEQTKALLSKFRFANAKLNTNGEIENTECAMNRLLLFDVNMNVIGNQGITILQEAHDKSGKLIGYVVMDENGHIGNLSEKDIVKLVNNGGQLINGKIVSKGSNTYVSAIKSEFTHITVDKDSIKDKAKEAPAKEELTPQDLWRFQMHNDKLMKRWMRYILTRNLTGGVSYLNQGTHAYYNTKRGKAGINFTREINIICNEIAPKLGMTEQHKKILDDVRNNIEISDVIKDSHGTENDRLMATVVSQVALLSNDKYIIDSIKRNSKRRFRLSKELKECKDRGWLFPETAELIKSIADQREAWTQMMNNKAKFEEARKFNTKEFKSAVEMAQLGFTTLAKNSGIEFETEAKSKYHLKFVGDSIKSDYDYFMKYCNCLGDIVSVAALDELLINKKYTVNNSDSTYRDSSNIEGKDIRAKAEIILAFVAICNPTLCQKYIENRSSDSPELKEMLPGFDFSTSTDFNINKDALKLYYGSGYNVFYNDYGKLIKNSNGLVIGTAVYSKEHLRNAELINYRSLGPKHRIASTELYSEFAPVINLITSEELTSDDIICNIGALRII
jgi:hypothetical protein